MHTQQLKFVSQTVLNFVESAEITEQIDSFIEPDHQIEEKTVPH